jgi:hypothetical protein
MFRKVASASILFGIVLLLGAIARAQSTDSTPQKPLPPLSPLGPQKTVDDTGADEVSTPGDHGLIPDWRPLAGAQELTLGTSAVRHSFVLPSLSVLTQAGPNPFIPGPGAAPGPTTESTSYVAGRLGLNRMSERSELSLDYLAGASFSNEQTVGNSLIQNLDASELIRLGRWSLFFADDFGYLSNSPFGFGGLGGLKNLGVSLGNGVGTGTETSSSFAPGQSIYINGLPRINNTSLGQTGYALSRRSSLTFVGSYTDLTFMKSPLEDSKVASFQGGYDYLLSRQNAMSVFYRFDDFTFSSLVPGIRTHSVEFVFARRITGRLSLQVGAGPSFQAFQNPLSGAKTLVSPIASAGLKYRMRYTAISLNYSHALTNGSGVLPGAETDVFSGGATRTLGRSWDFSFDGGYSRNRAVQETLSTATGVAPQTWFTTLRFSRHLVGYGAFFVSYDASGQSSLASVCTLPSCRMNTVVSMGSVGYTWGLRPVPLE